jgi:hypothetical protein
MPETRAQKIARLKAMIDADEQAAARTIERAEKRREMLLTLAERPAEPTGYNMFMSRVKFKGTSIIYTFLFLRTPAGYYSTGSGKNSVFRTWDILCDWLDSDDIESHTGLEAIVETGETYYPERERGGGYPL